MVEIFNPISDLAELTVKNHSDLDQLVWSTAGHTIDTNFDFAGFNLLNCGIININATADHTIANSSDDLVFTNPNSGGDFTFNLNLAGTPTDLFKFDGTSAQLLVSPITDVSYALSSPVVGVGGNLRSEGFGTVFGFNSTVTSDSASPNVITFLAQPTFNTAANSIAFYLGSKATTYSTAAATITSGSAVITGITSTATLVVGMRAVAPVIGGIAITSKILSIDSATQVTMDTNCTASGTGYVYFGYPSATTMFWLKNTHASNFGDTLKIIYHQGESRGVTNGFPGTYETSDCVYDWVALGGTLTMLNFGVNPGSVTETDIKLTGGCTRSFGTGGAIVQKGLQFTGFGTQSGLIAGTDSCYAMYADGGWFAHKYDYVYTGAAGPNQGIFMGAGTLTVPDMGIGYQAAGNGLIDTSINGASDLNVACGTDKTIELQETVWDDLKVPALATKVGASTYLPAWTQVATDGAGSRGVYTWHFSAATPNEVFFTAQMPHTYKEGTDLSPHVHWLPDSTNTGVCRWVLEYSIANINGTFGNTAYSIMEDAGSGTINDHLVAGAAAVISGSGLTVSHMLICRLYRDTAHANDTFTGNAGFIEFDIHHEINTLGSRQLFIK